jgi:hypothetical protein
VRLKLRDGRPLGPLQDNRREQLIETGFLAQNR